MADRQMKPGRAAAAPSRQELAEARGFGAVPAPAGHDGAGHSISRITVGPVDDGFEREADAVADRVMRREDGTAGQGGTSGGGVDASVAAGTAGGGESLRGEDRSFFEEAFGHDFSGVRVHSGGEASRSARDLSALAYTRGPDVVFREGGYRPGSPEGRHLLAHELTHVVQQGAAPATGPGGSAVSHSGPGRIQRAPDLMPELPPDPMPDLPPGAFDFPKIPGETPFNFGPSTAAGTDAAAAGATDAAATSAAVTTDAAATTVTAGALETGGGAAVGLGAEAILPVTAAAAAGVGAGMLLDAGVNKAGQAITGDDKGDYSLSNGIAHVLTAADQGVSSLWSDPSKPEYTQTLGWKLANWLTPTSNADTPPAVAPGQTSPPATLPGADTGPAVAPGATGTGPATAAPKVDYDPDLDDDDDTPQRGEKGKTFRGGKKTDRDNWYGYDDPDFQNWWHRDGKQGRDIQNADDAKNAFDQWVSEGRPKPK